jgi:hypothetical protein
VSKYPQFLPHNAELIGKSLFHDLGGKLSGIRLPVLFETQIALAHQSTSPREMKRSASDQPSGSRGRKSSSSRHPGPKDPSFNEQEQEGEREGENKSQLIISAEISGASCVLRPVSTLSRLVLTRSISRTNFAVAKVLIFDKAPSYFCFAWTSMCCRPTCDDPSDFR